MLNETIIIALVGLVMFGVLCLLIFSINNYEKEIKKTRTLFRDVLEPMCKEASTEKELYNAWNVLIENCFKDNTYTAGIAFRNDFIVLRALLQGKFQSVKHIEQYSLGAFFWKDMTSKPKHYGRYMVHRKDGKMHLEVWNGIGWAYNGVVITHWMEIHPPITTKV